MKTISIKLDPADVDLDDVEDFLATDELFVEYFNVFLALPTFPEPLFFNKDTGGFEVVSVAKKELANKIKEALRTQARTARIYRVAKKHSYIDIPLIPIEDEKAPENQEIHTSFSVTTLNKEQGIHWVKAERLPAFLDSDLYLEYRLSKLLSQARITGEQGEYVLLKIDYKPRIKKSKKKKDEEEVKVDPKEALMKDLYVCMGNATTTETDAWYATAKIAAEQETTYSTASRPDSGTVRSISSVRPTSARPTSAYSDPYLRSDSGMGSSIKGSARSKNSSYNTLYQNRYNQGESEDDIMMSKLFSSDSKPNVPRLTDNFCVVSKEDPSVVYAMPKPDPTVEFHLDDNEQKDDEKDSGKGDDETIDMNESMALDGESGPPIVFENIEDVGSVIVSVVLKRAIMKLTDMDECDVEKIPEIQQIFPEGNYSNLSIESLDRVTLVEENKPEKVEETAKEPDNEPKISEKMKQNLEVESDVDSLLDSDEDYEESDTFFRKHKFRTYSLCTKKGVNQFKQFLKGTLGERNWSLWVDIDRMRLMTNESEIQLYLYWLREKYHKPGAEFELTVEQKAHLGLSEPSAWTIDKLMTVHNQIAEPLVLYWAPRFLLKQMMRTNPDKNLLYHHLKHLKPPIGVDPNPPTASLLPLRPKTCHPRMKEPDIAPQDQSVLQVQEMFPEVTETFETSPPVGLRRSYAQPTLKFIANWQREQMVHTQLISPRLNIERTSTPRLRRPMSAKVTPKSSVLPVATRPKSAVVNTSRRPSTAHSTISNVSVESATGRVRIKTPSHSSLKTGSKTGQRSRPSSASSSIPSIRSEDIGSDVSEFPGGNRMEHLLQALHNENNSGGFFRRYVERSGSRMWINNLNLWRDVQAYHMMFYGKNMDPYVVHKKAKSIFSKYIVVRAACHIGVGDELSRDIRSRLTPPYEELFDEAEEHAITVVYEAWQEMWEMDQKTYNKVELIEVKRHLETKSKYVINLQKRGLIKERVSSPDVMEGYEDPVYDEALIDNIPEEFKDYTLEKLVHNRIELEHFRNFLAENYASMDIMCWMDIEAYRRITHADEKKRDVKAREIKMKYLNKKYFFGANSPAGKEGQDKVAEAGGGWGKLLEDRPPTAMILEAQKYVQERLEKKWLPLFLVTPDFAVRQRPRQSMDDVVDDVIVQKKKKSLNMLKLLDSKWVSSSKEIIIFRKALLNPITNIQFRRFVSIKGDSLENDVLFWLEVQKFKEMYHAHCDDSLIIQKINTIVNCFIESQIPPSLQIDIPPEMAEKILDRKYEKCPYLFREAQLVVFRVLFPHWTEFCEFRLNIAEEKVMPTIERRRRHARAKERKRIQEQEEKLAREAERRIAMGLPPLGEEDDVFHDPFKALGGAESVEGEAESEEKDKIAWTYSNYMNALEREELLNNTDESSFTSLLTDTASVKSEMTDRASVGTQSDDKKGIDSIDRRNSILTKGENGKTKGRKSSMDIPARGDSRLSRVSKTDSVQSQKVTIQDPKSTVKTKQKA